MSFKPYYYVKRFGYNELPSFFFRRKYERLKQFEKQCDQKELNFRLDYYFKINERFDIPEQAVAVKDFRRTGGTDYFLDLKEFLHYFSPETRFAYHFGDETHINPYPTLFKARPIKGLNDNSVLFKLNKTRHFRWVDDPYVFSEKKDMMVWRGHITHNKLRKDFVKKFWDNPLFNVGIISKSAKSMSLYRPKMTIKEQLKYKFIFCPEGNDVATSLKWVMSSNSLCFMPEPRFETWFMEGLLKPNVHYVEVKSDLSDLEDKMQYYSKHTDEAEEIIRNAHKHVERFKNKDLEDLLCLRVLEKYTSLSGQSNALRFA